MEDAAVRPAQLAPETFGSGRDQVDALLRQIASGGTPGRTAADRLPAALRSFAAAAPADEVSAYCRQLLDARSLDGYSDSAGLPCRAALIQTQLGLGFPHALEVNPDDLTWYRNTVSERTTRPTASRVWTAVFALLSIGWSGLVLALTTGGMHGAERWLGAPFVAGGLHGLVALLAAAAASPALPLEERRRWRRLYGVLHRLGWLGPAFASIAAFVGLAVANSGSDVFTVFFGVGFIGLFCAAPAMLTAVAAGVAGKRLVPEDEAPTPTK